MNFEFIVDKKNKVFYLLPVDYSVWPIQTRCQMVHFRTPVAPKCDTMNQINVTEEFLELC